ncbi:protein germ cell-less isoform X2 [Anthonomus grandis grandis]|uniref:protein germ cell-less isoform X2 n=1 Tax=Anthonomus grandis grandis TaxID=2921223 RepID=UPI002166AA2B|nr:protein germ cell-less isoform X2 [Anthonomus grandis grandis]
MGGTFSTLGVVENVKSFVTGRKRKLSETDDETSKVIEIALHTPKKKKLLCTAKYIYQALFVEGKNSDVTVCALGKEHYLHRVYLCQSPYFASMFGGSWLETTQKYITIDVVDPQITLESLQVVFGSLYLSDIALNPLEIVPILATATMFQLDGLIEQCTEVMLETINPKTSLDYYNAACQYGDRKLQEACIRWFLVNLMSYYYSNSETEIRTIPISLMTKLVGHPDLFTIQTEYSIYVMLKFWIYAIKHPEVERIQTSAINNFFANHKTPFLYTSEGKKYIPVFQELRLQNLISHQLDIVFILKDNIIPKSWMNPVVLQQWKNVLRVNQNEEKGPVNVPDDFFLRESLRCGRIITSKERHVWRWTGFHFGLDLLMITHDNTVSVKRNHRSEFEQLLSFQTNRYVALRITVAQLNEQRQITYIKQSDIQKINLTKGEEVTVMTFKMDVVYPLIISANILYVTPEPLQNKSDQLSTWNELPSCNAGSVSD